jgi:hypothetical protein
MRLKGPHKVTRWFPEWASHSKLICSTLSSLELSSFVGVSALPGLIHSTMLARHWLNNATSSVDSWCSPAPSSHLSSNTILAPSFKHHPRGQLPCAKLFSLSLLSSGSPSSVHRRLIDSRAQSYLVPTTPHRASSLLRKSHIHPTTTHIGVSSNRYTHRKVCYMFHPYSRTQSMLLLAVLTATYCLLIRVHNFILILLRKPPCRMRANRR